MSKSSTDSIYKDMKMAKYRVMSDPEVVSMFYGQKNLKSLQRKAFRKSEKNVSENVKFLKKNSKKSYLRLVESQLKALDSIIDSYSRSLSQLDEGSEKPTVLYKFMPKDHAVDNILSSRCSFGSVGLYRKTDESECKLPIAPEMDLDQ